MANNIIYMQHLKLRQWQSNDQPLFVQNNMQAREDLCPDRNRKIYQIKNKVSKLHDQIKVCSKQAQSLIFLKIQLFETVKGIVEKYESRVSELQQHIKNILEQIDEQKKHRDSEYRRIINNISQKEKELALIEQKIQQKSQQLFSNEKIISFEELQSKEVKLLEQKIQSLNLVIGIKEEENKALLKQLQRYKIFCDNKPIQRLQIISKENFMEGCNTQRIAPRIQPITICKPRTNRKRQIQDSGQKSNRTMNILRNSLQKGKSSERKSPNLDEHHKKLQKQFHEVLQQYSQHKKSRAPFYYK